MRDITCQLLLSYSPTPVQEIQDALFASAGVRVLIKREDLNHPFVSGNKWWKLKYNLAEAMRLKKSTLLTFGGAYSNHIYATAAAARELNLKSIGIIRGEETLPLNETLAFATACGMELHYVARSDYREKTREDFVEQLQDRFGDFYLIPEGGTNALAVQGVESFCDVLNVDFDYMVCAVGTGGTIAGLINGLPAKRVVGIPVLKGATFLEDEIKRYVKHDNPNWELLYDYHVGGYAKTTPVLTEFMMNITAATGITLEPVYTGKLFYAVYDLIAKNYFNTGATVLLLHSGGLRL